MAKPRLWYLKLDRSASQPGRCLPPTVALFGRTCSCVTNLVNPASSERFPEVTDCWSRFGESKNVGGAPLLGAYLQHLTLCCSRPPLPFSSYTTHHHSGNLPVPSKTESSEPSTGLKFSITLGYPSLSPSATCIDN